MLLLVAAIGINIGIQKAAEYTIISNAARKFNRKIVRMHREKVTLRRCLTETWLYSHGVFPIMWEHYTVVKFKIQY